MSAFGGQAVADVVKRILGDTNEDSPADVRRLSARLAQESDASQLDLLRRLRELNAPLLATGGALAPTE